MKIAHCTIDDVEITYRIIDDTAGDRALVLSGGLGGTHLIWSGLVRALRDKFRIFIWDYPGLTAGAKISDTVRVDVPQLARYQTAVVDAEHLERFTLVGWSLGTQVAIESARHLSRCIQAIVAVCGLAGRPFVRTEKGEPIAAALGIRSPLPDAVSWLSDRMDKIETLRSMLRRIEHPTRWAKRLGLVDNNADDLVFDAVIRDFLALDQETYRRYVQSSADHDASDLLPHLPFPLLAVAGQRDRFLTASCMEKMVEKTADAELYQVRGATHFLPLEYYHLLALKIEDFVKKVPGI